jgi:hypothetical protein
MLAVEGEPMMSIWRDHQNALSADILDNLLRQNRPPDPHFVMNKLLVLKPEGDLSTTTTNIVWNELLL